MTVNWKSYLWNKTVTASDEAIKNIEAKFNIKFPKDYLEIVKENQGKVPKPNIIKIGNITTGVNELFHFEKNESYEGSAVLFNIEILTGFAPDKIIPIMGTGGGNSFGFDFRKEPKNPSVVYIVSDLEGEEAIKPVADNFTNFLSLLKSEN